MCNLWNAIATKHAEHLDPTIKKRLDGRPDGTVTKLIIQQQVEKLNKAVIQGRQQITQKKKKDSEKNCTADPLPTRKPTDFYANLQPQHCSS